MSSGWFVVQRKALFSYNFPFETGTVRCINVPVVPGIFFHAQMRRASGERDLARRSRSRLGSCSLIALHHAEVAPLLPSPPHEQQLPVLCPVLDPAPRRRAALVLVQGRRWQCQGGQRRVAVAATTVRTCWELGRASSTWKAAVL